MALHINSLGPNKTTPLSFIHLAIIYYIPLGHTLNLQNSSSVVFRVPHAFSDINKSKFSECFIMSTKRGTHDLFLFTYGNRLLNTCAFPLKIYIIFVYLFKLTSTTAAQVTTFVYLLMEIASWLHVLFVLVFSIYLFTYSKGCQQK